VVWRKNVTWGTVLFDITMTTILYEKINTTMERVTKVQYNDEYSTVNMEED